MPKLSRRAHRIPEKEEVSDYRRQVGAHIRSLRERRGYSLRGVAESIGISSSYLSLLERGIRPLTIDHLYQLAFSLGINVRDCIPD